MKQFLGVADRNCKVGPAESVEDGEIHSDDFAAVIEKRAARAAGGGRRIVNDFVLQHVADMALRRGGANQILLGQAGNDLRHVGRAAGNLLRGFRARARQDAFDARG